MAEPSDDQAAVPGKADPAGLEMHGRPQPVVRFRRGVLVGAASLGSVSVAGIAWLSFKPVHWGSGQVATEQAEPQPRAPDDALGKAPKGYGDIPQLGPPLPGDLGRPILEHQRSLGVAPPATPVEDPQLRAQQAAEAERQRIVAETRAAREAGVMVDTSTAQAESLSVVPASSLVPPSDTAQDGQVAKLAFLERRAGNAVVDPGRLQPAPSPTILSAGSVIAASLVTGLNSDLPGFVIAQVTQPVYDSPTGQTMLIPQGARLLGRYDSVIAFGQTRALVVWQRILMPNGSSISVDNLPATDTRGYAGLADKLDLHSWQLLKGVGLSTLLGVGTQLTLSDESDLVRALRESAQQSGARAGDRLVQRALEVQPTITVRPGWPLRVILHKDLVLPAWMGRAGQ